MFNSITKRVVARGRLTGFARSDIIRRLNDVAPRGPMRIKDWEMEVKQQLKLELSKAASYNAKQWDELSNRLLNRELKVPGSYVNAANIDGVIMRLCDDFHLFDTGQSFFKRLQNKTETLNDGILSRYINLCADDRKFAVENEELIIGIYNKLKSAAVVEPLVAERCIRAVCLFENHWEDAFNLVEQVKLLSQPTPTTYFAIVEACFKFGDVSKGWELLKSITLSSPSRPSPPCYLAYLDYCATLKQSGDFKIQLLEDLFTFLEDNHLHIPSLQVLDRLDKFIFSLTDDAYQWSLKETYIPKNAVCSNCRQLLEPVRITSEEFQSLCKRFVKRAVIGSNIFLKSTPDEIARFKTFLDRAHPYDIVVDGLNVAYSRGNRPIPLMANILRAVVKHFVDRKHKVLVLGRNHMKKWPESAMQYIRKNSNIFFAMNLSHDDPLLLYAALKGGEKTYIVSRDYMRTHLFALEDAKARLLFRKWLSSHQYRLGYFTPDGKHNILNPLPYRPTAQKLPSSSSDWCWHIPYDEIYQVVPPDKREPPPKWICVRRVLKGG